MIDASKIGKFVGHNLVQNLYAMRERIGAQLSEAKAATTNPHLMEWKPEARLLVNVLENSVKNYDARIAAFEAAVPPLEAAIAAEGEATEAHAKAKAAHALGSLDRKEALRLRDDEDYAHGVMNMRYRARLAAVSNVGSLPNSAVVQDGPGKEIIETIATVVTNVRFRHDRLEAVPRDTWTRWLEMQDGEAMWLPFHAERLIKTEEAEQRKMDLRADYTYVSDHRRIAVVLPIPDFIAELNRLKSDRTAHLRSKISQAQATLDTARQQAAVVSGSATQTLGGLRQVAVAS